MTSPARSKLNEILTAAGVAVQSNLAAKYYDFNRLKKTVLEDLSQYALKDLEFEEGKYELAVDFVGTLETAVRSFGLEQLGIVEDENGYTLGDQTAKSIEELEFAEEVVMEFAEKIAHELNERVGLSGVFYFGYNADWADGALRLFFAFDQDNVSDLYRMGAKFSDFKEPEMSFAQIIASLEQSGYHEAARKLYDALRGQ